MRMNPAQAESAADLANGLDDAALKRIFANYGELNHRGDGPAWQMPGGNAG